MKTTTYTLPLFWASYLINREDEGYTQAELCEIRNWQSEHADLGDAFTMEEIGFSRVHGQEMAEYVFPVVE